MATMKRHCKFCHLNKEPLLLLISLLSQTIALTRQQQDFSTGQLLEVPWASTKIDEKINPNDNQLSVPVEIASVLHENSLVSTLNSKLESGGQQDDDDDDDDNNNQQAPVYERVVLAGSNISIKCPHFEVQHQQQQQQQQQPSIKYTKWLEQSTLLSSSSGQTYEEKGPIFDATFPQSELQQTEQKTLPDKASFSSPLQVATFEKHTQVKWFRNHVPLVNLNHLHYGCCNNNNDINDNDNDNDNSNNGRDSKTSQHHYGMEKKNAQVTTIRRETELNQTTELSSVASVVEQQLVANNKFEQKNNEMTTALLPVAFEERNYFMEVPTMKQVGPADFEQITRENVDEQVGSVSASASTPDDASSKSRKNSNLVLKEEIEGRRSSSSSSSSSSSRRKGSLARWYVNKFGELIINRVSANFVGKYTCLVLGKQSDVLLHVTRAGEAGKQNSSDSLIHRRHRRRIFSYDKKREKMTNDSAAAAASAASLVSQQISVSKLKVNEASRQGSSQWDGKDELNTIEFVPQPMQTGSRQSVTGSELRTGTSAFPDSGLSWIESASAGFGTTASSPSSDGSDHGSVWREILSTASVVESTPSSSSSSSSSSVVESTLMMTKKQNDVGGLNKKAMMNQSANDDENQDDEQLKEDESESVNSDQNDDDDDAAASSSTLASLDASIWMKAPIQNVRIESIQLSDLKFIPGLIYTKQKLHCPLWRSLSFWRESISTLAQILCSSEVVKASFEEGIEEEEEEEEEIETPHLRECHELVRSFFLQLVEDHHQNDDDDDDDDDDGGSGTPKKSDEMCNTSILELAWLKEGNQLEFDSSTGKGVTEGAAGAANVRLINFCDQLETSSTTISGCNVATPEEGGKEEEEEEAMPSVKEKKESMKGQKNSDSSTNTGTGTGILDIEMLSAQYGPISRSESKSKSKSKRVSWLCPSIGRTLEIDGVRQDSAGHFSCAFKLNILKLQRYILDMLRHKRVRRLRRRLELLTQRQKQHQNERQESIPASDPNISSSSSSSSSSCCEKTEKQSVKTVLQLPLQPGNLQKLTDANEMTTIFPYRAQDRQLAATTAIHDKEGGDEPTPVSEGTGKAFKHANGNKWINLSKLIVKGLKELQQRLRTNEATNHRYNRVSFIASNPIDPMAIVQTFSLTVMERSAKTCDLWSTITEASDAYSRRKWLNFKQLKRDQQQQQQQRPVKSSVYTSLSSLDHNESKHDELNVGNSLSSSLSSSEERRELPAIESLSQQQQQQQQQPMNANLPFTSRETIVVEEQQQQQQSGSQQSLNSSSDQQQWPAKDQQQARSQFISVSMMDHSKDKQQQQQLPLFDDKWRLNNADDNESVGLDITSSNSELTGKHEIFIGPMSKLSGVSDGQHTMNLLNERPFNYANERNSSSLIAGVNEEEAAANKNDGIVPINDDDDDNHDHYNELERHHHRESSVRFKRSLRIESGKVDDSSSIDISSNGVKIKELITQIGRESPSSQTSSPILRELSFDGGDSSSSRSSMVVKLKDSDHQRQQQQQKQNESMPPRIEMNEKLTTTTTTSGDNVRASTRQAFSTTTTTTTTTTTRRSHHIIGPNDMEPSSLTELDTTIGGPLPMSSASIALLFNTADDYEQQRLDEKDSINRFTNGRSLDESATKPSSLRHRRRRFRRTATLMTSQGLDDLHTLSNELDLGSNSDIKSRDKKVSESGQFAGSDSSSSSTTTTGIDDDLMWIASQYLYMEVKAVAGSPLFGAEVSVEWSNERANNTLESFNTIPIRGDSSSPTSAGVNENHQQTIGDEAENETQDNDNHFDYGQVRDSSPFATIDVVPGQNLCLQCTAHALGRLPEVKWYKLITEENISKVIANHSLTRRIDGQLYWPLEELDLLPGIISYDNEHLKQTNFVQSQSTTLFNNLVNQTFTVISNLQLSLEGNNNGQITPLDENIAPSVPERPLLNIDGGQNLFACLVDADIRHNSVTIGVNFPIGGDSSINRIPIEISKRLQAKALFERSQSATTTTTYSHAGVATRGPRTREPRHLISDEIMAPNREVTPLVPVQSSELLDLMRNENKIEKSFWIALGNGSNQPKRGQDFPTSATAISIMIVVVFGSLLGLVFLTLKSYQRLTSIQFEYSFDDYMNCKDMGTELPNEATTCLTSRDNDSMREDCTNYTIIEDDDVDEFSHLMAGNSRCICQLVNHPHMIDHNAAYSQIPDESFPGHDTLLGNTLCTSQSMVIPIIRRQHHQGQLANAEQRFWRIPPSKSENESHLQGEQADDRYCNIIDDSRIEPMATEIRENPLIKGDSCNRLSQQTQTQTSIYQIGSSSKDNPIDFV